MDNYEIFLLQDTCTVADLIHKIEELTIQITVEKPNIFLVNKTNQLVGSVSDGDIRRGIIKGASLDSFANEIMNKNFRYLNEENFTHTHLKQLKEGQVRFVPYLNSKGELTRIIDLTKLRGHIPVDCVIMAGGRGERLRPMTDSIPKPLLKIGEKPIVEHTIDRLAQFGVKKITLSVRYLGDKLRSYFENGESKNIEIKYVEETEPLGTIGSVTLINDPLSETVLIMNSDLLTNIDYLEFYESFISSGADMAVATVPYKVTVPYAILETKEDAVLSLKEKPSFTYQSNAGIYLVKREIIARIPRKTHYNATDLMDEVIKGGKKLTYYPLYCYWLDIGKPEDYLKAMEDIKHLHL